MNNDIKNDIKNSFGITVMLCLAELRVQLIVQPAHMLLFGWGEGLHVLYTLVGRCLYDVCHCYNGNSNILVWNCSLTAGRMAGCQIKCYYLSAITVKRMAILAVLSLGVVSPFIFIQCLNDHHRERPLFPLWRIKGGQ